MSLYSIHESDMQVYEWLQQKPYSWNVFQLNQGIQIPWSESCSSFGWTALFMHSVSKHLKILRKKSK